MAQWISETTEGAMRHTSTSAAQPTEYRGSPVYAAVHPEVAAAPARRLIVPTGATVS